MDSDSLDFSYFDEAYFQGGNKGTAYVDYLNSAPNSRTYRQVAAAIAEVFRPVRCLEIGCATGAIVNHLNAMNVECHGIDVSQWAVDNRLHPNVRQSSAHQLDFPDNYFDVVFSVHALEHLPPEIADAAIREMSRVTRPDGVQFHLLPILGEFPYIGDFDEMRSLLRKDPTHNLIEPLSWWLKKWGTEGWSNSGLGLIFEADTETFELTGCQYLLTRSQSSRALSDRSRDWNRRMALALHANRGRTGVHTVAREAVRHLEFASTPGWKDAEWTLEAPRDLGGATLTFLVENHSRDIQDFRVALQDTTQSSSAHLEDWRRFPPGRSVYTCSVNSMVAREGDAQATHVTRILFGGNAKTCRMTVELLI